MGTGSIVEIALFPELHVGNGHQVFFIAVQQAFMVNHFFAVCCISRQDLVSDLNVEFRIVGGS